MACVAEFLHCGWCLRQTDMTEDKTPLIRRSPLALFSLPKSLYHYLFSLSLFFIPTTFCVDDI